MNVRIGRSHDAQLVLGGEFVVAVDIAFGIDDDGLSAARAPDEVRVLGEGGVEDLADEHGNGLSNRRGVWY